MKEKIYTMMKKGKTILFTFCFCFLTIFSLTACHKDEVLLSTETGTSAESHNKHNKNNKKNTPQSYDENNKAKSKKNKSAKTNGDKTKSKASQGNATDKVVVYVCGQVNKPGVYELSKGKRLFDAVTMAGGMNDLAAKEFHNLAACLKDGQMIYIPTKEEAKDPNFVGPDNAENIINNANNATYGAANNGVSDSTRVGNPVSNSESAISNGKVNINRASKEELMTIKGVGESKAESIIAYRTEHGNFSKIEDLKNITGIKNGIFNKLKDYITVN
ncbi:competence protein ComEA [Lachnospiraceae bacterium C7]|nr:competence protein ComEA [Lachnospiraceae bacterium C7]